MESILILLNWRVCFLGFRTSKKGNLYSLFERALSTYAWFVKNWNSRGQAAGVKLSRKTFSYMLHLPIYVTFIFTNMWIFWINFGYPKLSKLKNTKRQVVFQYTSCFFRTPRVLAHVAEIWDLPQSKILLSSVQTFYSR